MMFLKKKKIVIKIEGMSCEHCKNKVKTTLEKITEVNTVKVNLAKKEAIITSREKIDLNLLKEKIESLDYKVVDIAEEQ